MVQTALFLVDLTDGLGEFGESPSDLLLVGTQIAVRFVQLIEVDLWNLVHSFDDGTVCAVLDGRFVSGGHLCKPKTSNKLNKLKEQT